MGVSGSWIAFQGLTKEEALARTSLRDTGRPGTAPEAPVSGAVLPNGWYLIFFDHDPLSVRLEPLSVGCRIIACEFEEHAMVSSAAGYEDGRLLWEIVYGIVDGDRYDLHVKGTLPPEFAAIRDQAFEEQDDAGGQDADVDCVFDVPLKTAEAICGYHYEVAEFDWGEPAFTRLERVQPIS